MDVIKVRARCPRHARGGLDEFELKSLGKHGRDGVDSDGKPAARPVVVGLNPKPQTLNPKPIDPEALGRGGLAAFLVVATA